MDDSKKSEWELLGAELLGLCPEKFAEMERGLREVVEAQKIIAQFDHQLFFRGRPRKRYHA